MSIDSGAERQPRESVLGLVASPGNTTLVQRWIDLGADVYLKHQYLLNLWVFQFRHGKEQVHDVTVLHLASFFWNADVCPITPLSSYQRQHWHPPGRLP
ncbi:hypothetical protein BJX63DRAFT_416648 [Aspergillus granulosus]|uniref:Uncharacterized protein n=1 Tax=Aspergillus granulosus TaxID=176169 RepID=A0ABR4GT99_9EURO